MIPMSARRLISSLCEMVSKAAVRSRRIRIVSSPESAARRRSLFRCCALSGNPIGRVHEGCFCPGVVEVATTLSRVFEMKERLEMGL